MEVYVLLAAVGLPVLLAVLDARRLRRRLPHPPRHLTTVAAWPGPVPLQGPSVSDATCKYYGSLEDRLHNVADHLA